MSSRFPGQEVGELGYRVLGLDLDGVCADYVSAFRAYCQREMGLPSTAFPPPSDYNLVRAGWPFSNIGEYLAMHRRAVEEGLYRRLDPYPGLSESLNALSDASVHIRIVSHRLFMSGLHRQVASDTAEWLDACGVPYMSLCLTGLKDTVGSTVTVEDAPHLVDALRRAGSTVVVFDQPYNRNVPGPRLASWGTHAVDTILDVMNDSNSEP